MSVANNIHNVQLYMKPGCHLCDDARLVLEDIAAHPEQYVPFVLEEIDILQHPDEFDRYRYRIPVILIDSEEIVEGRIASEQIHTLRHALRR